MTKEAKLASHIPELDGIRGLAICLVLFYHFGQSDNPNVVSSVTGLGWSGVDLFFVLSGFLITGILLETKSSLNYFRIFYLRRFLRILPLYAIVLLLFFHVAVPVAHHLHKWPALATNTEGYYWTYLANWPIGHHQSVFALVPYWSLSVEEQFYALWPIVVLLSSETALAWISGTLVATAFVLRCLYSPDPGGIFVYVWTPFRMDTLALGALCAMVYRKRSWPRHFHRWLTLLGTTCVAAILLLRLGRGPDGDAGPPMQTFGYSLFGLAYSCLVLGCAIRSGSGGAVSRLLASRPLRRLGTVSYGVYLLHYIIFFVLASTVARLPGVQAVPPAVQSFLMIAVGATLSYAAGEISWRGLEERVLALKRKWPYRYRAAPAIASPAANPGASEPVF